MPDTATQPDLSALSQKERALWHMRNAGEIDRRVALDEYGIGRLAARIRDLRDEGYVIDARKDADGVAHYSLVSEPGEAEPGESGPKAAVSGGTADVETAEDLWRFLSEDSVDRDYVALLARCAQGKETVGALEDTTQPVALSDWEAASKLSREVTVPEVTEARERLCRKSPLVKAHDHRKGKPTYQLHPSLI